MAKEPQHSDQQETSNDLNPLFDGSSPLHDLLERRTIFAALDSFYQYRKNAHYNTTHRRRQNLYALPSSQWNMLAEPPFSMLDTLSAVDDAIDDNADLADAILQLGLNSFGLDEQPPKPTAAIRDTSSTMNWRSHAKAGDLAKAHSTIRQFYRDWSHEGFKAEVEPILTIVVADLEAYLPSPLSSSLSASSSSSPSGNGSTLASVLLPGAGLGRILFELCMKGYYVTGNEISYHQLLASNFILNATDHADQYAIYPFATTFTNLTSRANQLKRVTIPDVHPATAFSEESSNTTNTSPSPPHGEMNMTAGDFVLSYSGPDTRESFDAVVSVFFIDTAPNLIRYIETVWNCLRPDGVWINIGPLLWHFDNRVHDKDSDADGDTEGHDHDRDHDHDEQSQSQHQHPHPSPQLPQDQDQGIGNPGSMELSDDEVMHLLRRLGFEVLTHEILDRAPGSSDAFGYMQDPNSLLQNRYRCSHWVARKVAR